MKRYLVWIPIFLIVVSFLSFEAGPVAAAEKGIIALSYDTSEIPVVAAQQKANIETAKKYGYKAVLFDAHFDDSQNEILRSGTWATIRYARKKSKKVMLIFPDGTMTKENFN